MWFTRQSSRVERPLSRARESERLEIPFFVPSGPLPQTGGNPAALSAAKRMARYRHSNGGRMAPMSTVKLELEDDLLALLQKTNQPLEKAAREMIVLELYRRGVLSSGKAAQHLGMSRLAFIQHASDLAIAYFDMTKDEWEAEKAAAKSL
jgi:predicted HTH domain antitoxin